MTRYLLDTNILSDLASQDALHHLKIRSKLAALENDSEVYASIISLYEMHYGIAHADNEMMVAKMKSAIRSICDSFQVIPLTTKGAEIFRPNFRWEDWTK